MTRRLPLAVAAALSVAALSCTRHPPAVIPAPASPAATAPAAAAAPVPVRLPNRLSDTEFWQLITDLSEADGFFRSDNLLSNEIWLQRVIPDLTRDAQPGRVYMGVGPEQNFTYISALKPAMVFIVDVRHGNLDLHLLYKALFEMSADRVEFVSRLFSRTRPDGVAASSSAREIFDALSGTPPDDDLFARNLHEVEDRLTNKHGFPLTPDDIQWLEYVYGAFSK